MSYQHRDIVQVVSHDLTVDCVDSTGGVTTLDVTFGFDPSDPYAVTMTFRTPHAAVTWMFGRDLLIQGMGNPAGEGDVHIWPCLDSHGQAVVIIELSSPDGELMAQARTTDVQQFVNRTLTQVPSGSESGNIDIETLVEALLGRTN